MAERKRRAPGEVVRFSSGSTLLNCVLGGGWPLSRVVNVVGDKSTGKTLLAIEGAANFVRAFPKGRVVYCEAEAAFDSSYAHRLGLPRERMELRDNVRSVEELFNLVQEMTKQAKKDKSFPETLIVVDSLDALTDDAEKDFGAGYNTQKAKLMSEFFRRCNGDLATTKVCLFVVSQERDSLAMFGKKTTRAGGRALDFYASIVLWLYPGKRITRTRGGVTRPVGVRTKAFCEKNKVGTPYRECSFPIYFNFGIEDVVAGIEWLVEVGRFEDLGRGKDEKKLLTSLDTISDEDYLALRESVSTTVRDVWREVEDGFLPTRSKYPS